MHLLRTLLKLNKPIYVGMAILDLSKTLMYSFHYNYMQPKYGAGLKLLFTDTDSLCYHVTTPDIYRDMKQDAGNFDTSDYPTDHFLFSNANKKVLGKMKDETAGVAIEEFVGLRSKMYSMTYYGQEKKTAKGIGRNAMRTVKHDNYKRCLFDCETTRAVNNTIRIHDHELYSAKVRKVGLSPFDDKRFVLDNGFDTLAHGHYKAKQALSERQDDINSRLLCELMEED